MFMEIVTTAKVNGERNSLSVAVNDATENRAWVAIGDPGMDADEFRGVQLTRAQLRALRMVVDAAISTLEEQEDAEG